MLEDLWMRTVWLWSQLPPSLFNIKQIVWLAFKEKCVDYSQTALDPARPPLLASYRFHKIAPHLQCEMSWQLKLSLNSRNKICHPQGRQADFYKQGYKNHKCFTLMKMFPTLMDSNRAIHILPEHELKLPPPSKWHKGVENWPFPLTEPGSALCQCNPGTSWHQRLGWLVSVPGTRVQWHGDSKTPDSSLTSSSSSSPTDNELYLQRPD